MHEMERAKLIRHHGKRLQDLGADNELINQMVARLTAQQAVCSSATEKQTEPDAPTPRIRRISPAKVCRGALGFPCSPNKGHGYIRLARNEAAGAPFTGTA